MDNKALFKWLLILASAPIWLPFLRALWEDLKKALREEGGLWGATPSEREIEEIRQAKLREDPGVVHEPLAPRGGTRPSGGARPRPGAPGKAGGGIAGGSLRRDTRRRGF